MTIKTGRGAGRPPKPLVQLSDQSLVAIALYFLKQATCKHDVNPAVSYLASLEQLRTR